MTSRSSAAAVIVAAFAGCAGPETAGEMVEMELVVQPVGVATDNTVTLPSGFTVEIERAKVLLGPVYLRAPKRSTTSALWRTLVPLARADPGHAQTLTEGQLRGEFLEQRVVDALSESALSAGIFSAESGPIDRLSVLLDAPRSTDAKRELGTHHAELVGIARRGDITIPLDCTLVIDAGAGDTPKNLEARRRVDQIALPAESSRAAAGARLVLNVHVGRWLEFVDFDAFVPDENPCDRDERFALQWYLGIRRPEAFSAQVETRSEP